MSAISHASEPLTLDGGGHLDMDLPCVGCGYNLRGLSPQTTCPECGKAVGYATRLVKLGRRDPLYLRRIAVGLRWAITGMTGMIAASACGFFWLYFRGHKILQERVDGVAISLFTAGAVLMVIGIFLVTTPHLRRQNTWRLDQRQWARLGITVGLAMFLVGLRLSEQINGTPSFLFWGTCSIILAVGFCSALHYAAAFAGEIDHRGLAHQARLLAALLTVMALIVLAFIALQFFPAFYFGMLRIFDPWRVLFIWIAVMAVLMLWALGLLLWYHRRLLEAARLSERMTPI